MKNQSYTFIQITSGQGPDECALAVYKLVDYLLKVAGKQGVEAELVDMSPGQNKETYVSAVLSFSGDQAEAFIEPWIGAVQWICTSPFRPKHRRKNWFVGVGRLSKEARSEVIVKAEDISWKAVKASGPGGQHVNTTDSAVQALHRPSGVRVTSSEGRSQHDNKKRAFQKINAVLCARKEEEEKRHLKKQWETHNDLERGNPVKVFVGEAFKPR